MNDNYEECGRARQINKLIRENRRLKTDLNYWRFAAISFAVLILLQFIFPSK